MVSIASCWEIAIKVGLKKLEVGGSAGEFLGREIPSNNLEILPISLEHATSVQDLPFHHRDLFDRLLIAQALHENIPIVGADPVFESCGVTRLW